MRDHLNPAQKKEIGSIYQAVSITVEDDYAEVPTLHFVSLLVLLLKIQNSSSPTRQGLINMAPLVTASLCPSLLSTNELDPSG